MAIPLVETPVAHVFHRRLVLSPRLRTFELNGRSWAHTSAIPLVYLATSPGLRGLLQTFAQPQRLTDVLGAPRSSADERFFLILHRVGVLLDADAPDPIHTLPTRQPASRTLLLYPTSACNLRCVYCHADSGPESGKQLSCAQADSAVDHFFTTLDEGVRAVTLSFHGGGEPTTHFQLMRTAWERFRQLARQRGLAATAQTITNGVFGPAVLRTLQEPEWRVVVSYDGPRQGVQRPTAAARDSRARVVANLRALQAAGKTVTTRATLTRDGLDAWRALVDDAADLGIRQVQVEPASVVGRGANLHDGPPDPLAFAAAFLDAFYYALRVGVQLTTAAWSHTRVGNGRYCSAIHGLRALTPDGFLSACTEVGDGRDPDDPFIVGRQLADGRLDLWPTREAALQQRIGYHLPDCRDCFMVDTCAGGCASRARAQSGNLQDRDRPHCLISQRINAQLIADLADGRLLPDPGWQPMTAELDGSTPALAGLRVRLVALVPPFARSRWNADPDRRPAFLIPRDAPWFFHLPPGV
jgi:uncharacterized protein